MEKVIAEIKALHQDSTDIVDFMCPDDIFEIQEPTNKRLIFVFERFETPAFDHMSKFPGIYILGLKVVLSVIHDNLKIPASIFHINNLYMKDMILCFSSIGDPEKKARMKKLIEYMGGLYSDSLTDVVTHVVTEDVFSKKCVHAGSHNIKIMHTSWIQEMWKFSQDFEFVVTPKVHDKFKLKMFHNLIFSSTGLTNEEKKVIVKLVEDNGGEYSNTLRTATVKVLVLNPNDAGNLKHKASMKHSIVCIDPSWVIDSVKASYALNTENYLIKKGEKIKASKPTKNTPVLDKFSFDNILISDICDLTARSMDEPYESLVTRASSNFSQKLPETAVRPKTSVRPSKPDISIKSKNNLKFKNPKAKPSTFLNNKTVCVYGNSNDKDCMRAHNQGN